MKTKPQVTPEIFDFIYAQAKDEIARGNRRVSVRKLLEQARAHFKVPINNNCAPDVADRLITCHPDWAKLIETRARNRRGKNKKGGLPTLQDLRVYTLADLRKAYEMVKQWGALQS
jgi:hypothetical protein